MVCLPQYAVVVICILAMFDTGISTKIAVNHNYSFKAPEIAHRIVDGREVQTDKYPFIAGLIKATETIKDFFCGACIISKHWVISADHCFRQYIFPNRLNSDNIGVVSNNNTWKNGIIHAVDKWVRHKPEERDFDIALFKVKDPFTENYEKPIPIAADGYILRHRTSVKVLGWGLLSGDQLIPPDTLNGVRLKLYTDVQCRNIYEVFANKYETDTITPRMFCAGPAKVNETKDSCNLDSGGPIVDDDILIGIVSWGAQSREDNIVCGIGYPGVYVRLWKFESWIHEIEAQEGETIAQFKVEPNWISGQGF